MPRRRRRKRVGVSSAPPIEASAPNVCWGVDFSFDADERGRPIKIFSISDEHTRECLGGMVERSITATDVISQLDKLVVERGTPLVLRCDIHTESGRFCPSVASRAT